MTDHPKNDNHYDEEVELLLSSLAMDLEAEIAERRPEFIRRVDRQIAADKKQRTSKGAIARGASNRRPMPFSRTMRIAAAFFLIAVTGSFVWLRYRSASSIGVVEYSGVSMIEPGSQLRRGTALSTGEGEMMALTLDEGRVRVLLDQKTKFQLAEENIVNLSSGEVMVEVRPNSGRFEVETAFGTAVVTGTSFCVSAGPEASRVMLLHGKVSVINDTGEQVLEAGSIVNLASAATAPVVLPDAISAPPDWAKSLLFVLDRGSARQYYPSVVPDKNGQVRFDR